MRSKRHIKLSSYNQGKLDSKQLFESKLKFSLLEKEKNRVNKSFAEALKVPVVNEFAINYPNTNDRCSWDHLGFKSNAGILQSLSANKYRAASLYSWSHDSFHNIILASEKYFGLPELSHCRQTESRFADINEELRELRNEVKQNASPKLFLKIKQLVKELYLLVNSWFRKQKNFLKRLEIVFLNISSFDLRRLFRRRVRNLFKYFNDFSGSEEEEFAQNTMSINNFFNTINRKSCLTKMKLSIQLIYI